MSGFRIALIASLIGLAAGGASGRTLVVPFDFSKSEIDLAVTVKGTPLHVLLDTGVDPSAIDLARAEALHLKIDRSDAGEASGVGDAKHVELFGATIDGLAFGGRSFPPIEAATSDFSALSTHYGRRLDGMLGYSFLKGKIVLIDYPGTRFAILDRARDAASFTKSCRKRWGMPMQFLKDENWPVITKFRVGAAMLTATLDTGSNGGVTLYQGALDLPGLRAALVSRGVSTSAGFHGSSALGKYVLKAPLGFGPFNLPPGTTVTVRDVKGSADTSFANVGNKVFAAMKLKMLLDYRAKAMTFFSDCS